MRDHGPTAIATQQPTLDYCHQAILPLGLAARYRQHHARSVEGTWHLVEVRQDDAWRILGQGSTMLGAYRQAVERLERFGLATILAGTW